jgi:hypothetical protein
MVELDGLILPVDFFIGKVEGVSSPHLKDGEVSTIGGADEIKIGHPYTWLTDDQGISWRRNHPFCNVGLKVVDRRSHKIDIISPSCHDGIRIDRSMRVLFEKFDKDLPHLIEGKTLLS